MIEGLVCEMTSDELIDHLAARREFHEAKAKSYAEQAASVRELGAGNPAMSNDPSTSLAQSAETHRTRAAYFAFMVEHVILDETYRLTESDLTRIEIVSRYL